MNAGNPFLAWEQFPPFDRLDPDLAEVAVRGALAGAVTDLERLEAAPPAGWALVEELERLGDPLSKAWGLVHHLTGVRSSEALRAVEERLEGEVVAFGQRLGQSRAIYQALCDLRAGGGLDEAQDRILEARIREAELTGIALEGAERERFNAQAAELAAACTAFKNAVLDATKAWTHLITDPAVVEGMPSTWRALAAKKAQADHPGARPDSGPWLCALDAPNLGPLLAHCRDRALREVCYRAYVTRASSGELDNLPRLRRILQLRREQARLLGFASWAELSLSRKMAGSVERVEALLEQLRVAARPHAERDLAELRELAESEGAAEAGDLQPWDIAFWAERLQERRFGLKDEDLRPYFALDRVLEALFGVCERLFGITVLRDEHLPTWHEDVRAYRLRDASGAELAAFYLDPYSRPEDKRGGAWMGDCVGRSAVCKPGDRDWRLPVAYLCCNQSPPTDGLPSLMSFREVETLFHEFGHGLQHMLTQVPYAFAAGIDGVEWDAVELPSQFMENWAWHLPVLRQMAVHHASGEAIPQAWIEQMLAARTFRAGTGTIRQLIFGFTDLELHHRFDPDGDADPIALQHRIAATVGVTTPIREDRFICAFTHLFSSPMAYSAGYYSYKWAEVLSADAFGAFEEAGLEDEQAVATLGRRFAATVLGLGGGRHPMQVFRDFRGREPDPQALLRQLGLVA